MTIWMKNVSQCVALAFNPQTVFCSSTFEDVLIFWVMGGTKETGNVAQRDSYWDEREALYATTIQFVFCHSFVNILREATGIGHNVPAKDMTLWHRKY